MPALQIAAFLLALLAGFYFQQNAAKFSQKLKEFQQSPLQFLKQLIRQLWFWMVSPLVFFKKTRSLLRIYLTPSQKAQLKVSLMIAILSVAYGVSQGYMNGTANYDPLAILLALIGASVLFVTLIQVFRIVMSKTRISISFRWE